jgi:hypothetical protein
VHVRPCVPQPRRRLSRSSLWDTPPNAFARDHGWWQVSWLAGRRLGPPSQGQRVPSGIHGLWLAAYSCGGSCGIASVTDAYRIPFDVPCGHHRQRCLHRAAGESRTGELRLRVSCDRQLIFEAVFLFCPETAFVRRSHSQSKKQPSQCEARRGLWPLCRTIRSSIGLNDEGSNAGNRPLKSSRHWHGCEAGRVR